MGQFNDIFFVSKLLIIIQSRVLKNIDIVENQFPVNASILSFVYLKY